MARSTDLPTLETAVQAVKERKNFLIGVLSVLVLLIAVALFARARLDEMRFGPWRTALGAAFPWDSSSEDLARRAEAVTGTDAGALLRYWEALRMYDEGDETRGAARLAEFAQEHPDHYLVARTHIVPEDPGGSLQSPVHRQGQEMARMQEWGARYPSPTENPPPAAEKRLALVTDRGEVVLALYPERAPESCAFLLENADRLEGSFVLNARDEEWVELGLTEAGEGVVADVEAEKFPPLEDNGLSHFRGTVSFAQRAFSAAPHRLHLKVWLKENFYEDGNSTVLAQVTEGLELLTTVSKEAKTEDNFARLANPLKITGVRAEAPGAEDG